MKLFLYNCGCSYCPST